MATRDAYLGGGMTSADGGNPFAGGGSTPQNTSLAPVAQPAVGYTVTLSNGQRIMVGSEADYLKLKEWFGQHATSNATLGGPPPGVGGGGGGGTNWLRTGADALDGVNGFLRDRNIRRKMDDITAAMNKAAQARDALSQMSLSNPTLTPVINLVLQLAEAERDINAAALGALDDELTAVDLATGGAVARVLADFGVGSNRGSRGWAGSGGGSGSGSNWGTALAAGGAGLGLGLLLSNRNSNTTTPR